MQTADHLIRSMKKQTDALMASDEELQQFLSWVSQKSLLVKAPYKPAVIRAFYLGREYFDIDLVSLQALVSALDPAFDPPLDLLFDSTLTYEIERDRDFAIDIVLDIAIGYAFDLDLHVYAGASGRNLFSVLTFAATLDLEPKLNQLLKQLKDQLPDPKKREVGWWKRERKWWETNGRTWTKQLRSVMIEHRNIGHDWQFSKEQKQVLQQYYDANNLLVTCLNSSYNLTAAVREDIEETLLLPIAEIAKRSSCQER